MRFVLAALIALALLAVPATAGAAPVIGIADQKADMFGDPKFRELGIRDARIYVPWDALRYTSQRNALDFWMARARETGVRPIVTFGISRVRRSVLPTPTQFHSEARKFRTRFPEVQYYAAWNEANHCGARTCKRADRVAQYWRKLRQLCPRCTVLAGTVLDQPNAVSWMKAFRRAAKAPVRYWAFHNYTEANRFRMTRLRQMLAAAPGAKVWLTETGGLVARRVKGPSNLSGVKASPTHSNRVLRYLLNTVLPRNRKIERMYLYHWNSSTRRDTWDSALVAYNGLARPALTTLQTYLAARR